MASIGLITGANKGIGFATAKLLGERGWIVLTGSRDAGRGQQAAAELRAGGVDAQFVRLDVTDAASIAAAARWIDDTYGRLDALVNNAGIARSPDAAVGFGARPSETDLANMRAVYETNVFGVVAVTNAMLPLLRRAAAARIVNVSSEVGSIGSMTDPASQLYPMASVPYPSSKAALNMITAMYAKELRDTPIKVNAANPGYCATDLNGRSGFRAPEQGAHVSAQLATLPHDGPTGQLWGYLSSEGGEETNGPLPW
ncbi:MAG TPA: SDR family oxidoreductase [Streptosporangiaceae bacterium]|nr:SDR family oxidoreductase [Streptosporangiaceae bacterium]